MPAPPPQYRMQRASTQLSINLQQPMRANLNKNFGSSHDLKSPDIKSMERRQEKSLKKGRAPPPPVSNQNNNRIKVRLKEIFLIEITSRKKMWSRFRWRRRRCLTLRSRQHRRSKAKFQWVNGFSATRLQRTIRMRCAVFNRCPIALRPSSRRK